MKKAIKYKQELSEPHLRGFIEPGAFNPAKPKRAGKLRHPVITRIISQQYGRIGVMNGRIVIPAGSIRLNRSSPRPRRSSVRRYCRHQRRAHTRQESEATRVVVIHSQQFPRARQAFDAGRRQRGNQLTGVRFRPTTSAIRRSKLVLAAQIRARPRKERAVDQLHDARFLQT